MENITNLALSGVHGRPILVDCFYTVDGKAKSVVVFCHGFKGFKDWGPWNQMARQFAREGFVFVKFNFSHNGGTVEQPIDFPDLEAFGQNTFSKELDDLGVVLDWIGSNDVIPDPEVDGDSIGLVGHSRGGSIAILKAGEDSRIRCLATWAAVSDLAARLPAGEELEKWRREGVYYVANARTGQQMPLYFGFYQDFEQHRARFDVPETARALKIPFLILHGSEDETVPVKEAYQLQEWNRFAEIKVIEGTGHTFGGGHPHREAEIPVALNRVVDSTVRFLRKHTAR